MTRDDIRAAAPADVPRTGWQRLGESERRCIPARRPGKKVLL